MEREYHPLEWFPVVVYLEENADIKSVKEALKSTGCFKSDSSNAELGVIVGEIFIGENGERSEESQNKLAAVPGVKSIDCSGQRSQWGTAA